MRFVVDFAHEKYWTLLESMRRGDPDFVLPLGVYRHIHVVVEAGSHEEALGKAKAELAWPDRELALHPMSVASQTDVETALRGASHVPDPPPS